MSRCLLPLSVLMLVAGVLIRLVWIDADPDYYSWIGSYVDEGRWTSVARNYANHGVIFSNNFIYNTMIAPGFVFVSAISFLLLGVDHFTARLFPALCGAGTIVVLFFYLRRHTSELGVLCAVSLMAIQADLVFLSRIAIPETSSMLGALLTWIAIDAAIGSRRALAFAGCVLAGTLALKLTSYLLIPAFALVVFFQRPQADYRTRLADIASLLAVFGACGVIGLAAVVLWLLPPDALMPVGYGLLTFLEPNSAFGALARLLHLDNAPFLGTGMLALWFGMIALVLPNDVPLSSEQKKTQRRLGAAMIWAATFIFVMEIQAYFPVRYMVHLLLPLSLVAAFAAARLEEIGLTRLTKSLVSLRGPRKALAVLVLSLPSIIVTSPVSICLLSALGLQPDRLSTKLIALSLTSVPILLALARSCVNPRAVGLALSFPTLTILSWLIMWGWADHSIPFWPVDPLRHGLMWLIGLCLSLVVGHLAVGLAMHRTSDPFKAGGIAASLMWAIAWLCLILPGLSNPQFSLRNTSSDLSARLPREAEIIQIQASAIFIGNALDYLEGNDSMVVENLPEYVVTRVPIPRDSGFIAKHYDLFTSYSLHISARYSAPEQEWAKECGGMRAFCVGVFERRGGAELKKPQMAEPRVEAE